MFKAYLQSLLNMLDINLDISRYLQYSNWENDLRKYWENDLRKYGNR